MLSTSIQCPQLHITEIMRNALWHKLMVMDMTEVVEEKAMERYKVGGMKGFTLALKILYLYS